MAPSNVELDVFEQSESEELLQFWSGTYQNNYGAVEDTFIRPKNGIDPNGKEYVLLDEESIVAEQRDDCSQCKQSLFIFSLLLVMFCVREFLGELVQGLQLVSEDLPHSGDTSTVDPLMLGTYPKPFLITFFSHSAFVLYWPIIFVIARLTKTRIDLRIRVVISAIVCNFLLFLSTFLWFRSLSLTIVAANNAILQSLNVFLYLFSVLILGVSANPQRNCAMVLSGIGIAVVTICAQSPPDSVIQSTPVGYLLAVLSVVLYALFEVLYTCVDKDQREFEGPFLGSTPQRIVNTLSFIGAMGLSNVFFFAPIVFFADITGLDPLHLPSSPDQGLILIAVTVLLATLIGLMLVGVVLMSPLHMSICSPLLVPLGLVCDYCLHGIELDPDAVSGCFLIIAGFLVDGWGHCCFDVVANEDSSSDDEEEDGMTDFIDEFSPENIAAACGRSGNARRPSSPVVQIPVYETMEMRAERLKSLSYLGDSVDHRKHIIPYKPSKDLSDLSRSRSNSRTPERFSPRLGVELSLRSITRCDSTDFLSSAAQSQPPVPTSGKDAEDATEITALLAG